MAARQPNQVVESLYEALSRGDTASAAALLAPDVEWWFHGPRRCQYMRQLLTGEAEDRDFRFRPRTITEVGGGWVVAEGWEGKHAYWVHAWAVENDVIIRFREYFNTSVTVYVSTDSHCSSKLRGNNDGTSPCWESTARQNLGRTLPGLVLAI